MKGIVLFFSAKDLHRPFQFFFASDQWIDSIQIEDVYLYDELGRIEAAWFFHLNDLGPFIVDIDTQGNNYFDTLDQQIQHNKEQALKKLGIDPDYQYTKLY